MISFRALAPNISLAQPSTLLATWFGSGLIKPASGTWGSFFSLPFIVPLFFLPAPFDAICLIMFIIFTFIVGLWAAQSYMNASNTHDASEIVIDETCGLAISFLSFLLYTPLQCNELVISSIIIFALFRLFDAAKPYPISYLDKNVKGALGVMIDDVAAGLCASVIYLWGRMIWAHLV